MLTLCHNGSLLSFLGLVPTGRKIRFGVLRHGNRLLLTPQTFFPASTSFFLIRIGWDVMVCDRRSFLGYHIDYSST